MGVAEEHLISHCDKEKQAKYREAREAHREQTNEINRRYRETQKQKSNKVQHQQTNELKNIYF